MASDLSNIFKDELSNTLEQLLSKSASVESINSVKGEDNTSSQFIEVIVKFEFKDIVSTWKFYSPTLTSTKFEYLMLGGMGDLKEHIDDEIADAVNEIFSNICGSFCTSVNAQGFSDISSIKSSVQSSTIVEKNIIEDQSDLFELIVILENEELPVYIAFDKIILPFISSISGDNGPSEIKNELPQATTQKEVPLNNEVSAVPQNLELLYNIKLKLSVRLGSKVFLLKDILSWDIGEIIELEQMVNEPLEVLVNGVKIGEGEAVIVEGKFGLKIKKIGSQESRVNQIGL